MIKRIISLAVALLLCLSLTIPAFATSTRLFDNADLLTDEDEAIVLAKLDEVSELHNVDVFVAIVESVGDLTPDQYVNSFYDTNNLGYGDNKDGVLLLLSMEERDYRILSNGIAGDAISSDDIDTIGNKIIDDLSSGDYVSAFTKFADECEYYINGEINGFPFNAGKNLLISLAIGFVVAFIVTGMMRGQLKSVRAKAEASDYVKSGSMHVTHSSDLFLYRNVTRTKKAENSSSSSGSSRNVGGGKF
ncbi:MAG: TPM domain-containing protein [Clostridia bacterium]|nr:TPM domain-containing protein [Clostridia bacterium]